MSSNNLIPTSKPKCKAINIYVGFCLEKLYDTTKECLCEGLKNSKLRFVIILNTDTKYFYVRQKT